MTKVSDLYIGNERSFSARADFETPAKKMLFDIHYQKGRDWAKDRPVLFSFTEDAVQAAFEGVTVNSPVTRTELFAFLCGVIDEIKERSTESSQCDNCMRRETGNVISSD